MLISDPRLSPITRFRLYIAAYHDAKACQQRLASTNKLSATTVKALFLLTLLLAAFATGCTAKGSSDAQSATPGSYAIDPATVDTSNIAEPVSCMVVTSASQNSAFRIPTTCLAYPKAAIERGNYAGYLTCDADSTPHGKTFTTEKNSQAGQEKETDSFLADYFTSVCGARAQTGEIDLLAALNNAANDLRAHDDGSKMVLNVISSGLNSTGLLAKSSDLLNADPNDIANQLASIGALADFSGIEVHFYGLGQASGEQVIPSSIAAKLQGLYPTLVEATGGVADVEPDVLTPLGCDADLPAVSTIDFEQDSLTFPHLERSQSAQVVLDEAVLAFVGDSAEFIDPDKARSTLSELAASIPNRGATVLVEGYTAASPAFSHDELVDLSQRRAEAVRSALVAAGVSPGLIEVVGHGDAGATSMDTGVFSESAAKNDRRVVVTLSLA